MSTMISTQERATPLILESAESTSNLFTGIADAIVEIGYCIKLSAQALSFSIDNPSAYASESATRLDAWPVDLWVF